MHRFHLPVNRRTEVFGTSFEICQVNTFQRDKNRSSVWQNSNNNKRTKYKKIVEMVEATPCSEQVLVGK